ncbi:MAG: MFS transporter [Ktedonobacteraceae bacterium]
MRQKSTIGKGIHLAHTIRLWKTRGQRDEIIRSRQVGVTKTSVNLRSILIAISSTLLLRIANRISFVLLGFYLGEHFASVTVIALILESYYISELLLAPVLGGLSDRLGRKPLLILAPLLGACSSFFLFLSASLFPHPNAAAFDVRLLTLLLLLLIGRLCEGSTTALNTPACLGYIADATIGAEKLRAKVMTGFEVSTVGAIAFAIPFGGKVSSVLGIWGFGIVIALHLLNAAIIGMYVTESVQRTVQKNKHSSLLEGFRMLSDKRISVFLPAWLCINTLIGAWMTLIILLLTYPAREAILHHPGQMFYGGTSKDLATLLLGGFGLLCLVGLGIWMLLITRMRRTTAMLIGLFGLAMCIIALTLLNGLPGRIGDMLSGRNLLFDALSPFVLCGVLLLSGFLPASLVQLGALSETQPDKRGAVMGLYSVVLGIGQLLGASIGGLSVDLGGFYGLMIFSTVLGFIALGGVLLMRLHGYDLISKGEKASVDVEVSAQV